MPCLTLGLLIFLGFLWWKASENTRRENELRAAQERYRTALLSLEKDASSLEARKEALAAGRALAEIARAQAGQRGRAVFDEVELQNDLAIRIGAVAGTATRREPKAPPTKCSNCMAKIGAGVASCAYCGMVFIQT